MSESPASTRDPVGTTDGHTAHRDGEHGYVLATTALLLIPLMIFAALAVDVGGWYSKANQVQRAADAASLAAVVWMPDDDKALEVALETARQNGFDASDPDVDVQLSLIDSQSVRVDIIAKGDTYFGGVVNQDDVNLHRFATAQFILPVPMGNPSSALGTGNVPQIGGTAEGIWLAVNAKCYGREQGDHISTSVLGASGSCGGATNPQYDANGYYYVLDFPEGALTQDWTVQFYEPGICSSAEGSTSGTRKGPLLQTRLYRADNTLITDNDNIVDSNRQIAIPASDGYVKTFGISQGCTNLSSSPLNAGYEEVNWVSAFEVQSSDPAGRWILNVRSRADDDERGINTYAIRVTPSNAIGTACSTASGANLTTCPRVYAKDNLGIYATANDSWGRQVIGSGQPAAFYLAEIGAEHAGKTLEVTLFDPGEGMNNLQIVAPDKTRPTFTWETIDAAAFGITTNTNDRTGTNNMCYTTASASDPTTNVTGTYPCLNVTGSAYQNQTVRLRMEVPTGSACVSNDCWWRIRYQPQGSGTVTDKTVWSVRVVGDPVRLSE